MFAIYLPQLLDPLFASISILKCSRSSISYLSNSIWVLTIDGLWNFLSNISTPPQCLLIIVFLAFQLSCYAFCFAFLSANNFCKFKVSTQLVVEYTRTLTCFTQCTFWVCMLQSLHYSCTLSLSCHIHVASLIG